MYERVHTGWCVAIAMALAMGVPSAYAQQTQSNEKPAYEYATNGVLDDVVRGGEKWKLVLDESNLGGKELEIVEITLPAGTAVPNHRHGPIEVIYVLAGTYGHEVNGQLYKLTPGMVGIVRPGDTCRHYALDGKEAKILVMWVPSGDAARVFKGAQGRKPQPVPQEPAQNPR
jgi:quercetin dioxygenase-like cupin family protein